MNDEDFKESDLMDIEQAAAYLKISKMKLYELARHGKVPCFKLGSIWKFSKKAVDNWIADRSKERSELII
jgi:excisionase family DNA binding protein